MYLKNEIHRVLELKNKTLIFSLLDYKIKILKNFQNQQLFILNHWLNLIYI